MPKNDIGGFFVSLGMNIDKNSFDTGYKLIDSVGNAFNKLIGSARNAALVMATTAAVTGKVESANYKTAESIGVTVEALNAWRAAAKLADVNADSLVSSMGKIAGVMNRIKYDGSGLSELQKNLDKLQMSYSEIADLSADQATLKILEKAQSMLNGKNTAEIGAYVEDVLGAGARDFLFEANRRKISVGALISEGYSTQLTTSADNEASQNFLAEFNKAKVELESVSKLFGSNVATLLTPQLKRFNDWFETHGDDIKTAMQKLASAIEKIVGKTVDFITDENVQGVVETLKDSVSETLEGTGKILGGAKDVLAGNTKEGFEKMKEGGKQAATGTVAPVVKIAESETVATGVRSIPGIGLISKVFDKITMSKEQYDAMWGEEGAVAQRKKKNKVKDGIISPNGTVTQVAPDDWVFAARNIGDMARAFIPQNYNNVSAPSEYSIVQNFTINGASDMPQVLRQQAYKGTQDGLLELMQQSSRRLQLMSGTR